MGESTSLAKWSSLELLAEEDDSSPPNTATQKNQRKFIAHRSGGLGLQLTTFLSNSQMIVYLVMHF